MEFIAHDRAGWNSRLDRFTHVPSGDTLMCKPSNSQLDWDQDRIKWFKKYSPEITVHESTRAYSISDPLISTVEEILQHLEKRTQTKCESQKTTSETAHTSSQATKQ